jgi:hypothetical protein
MEGIMSNIGRENFVNTTEKYIGLRCKNALQILAFAASTAFFGNVPGVLVASAVLGISTVETLRRQANLKFKLQDAAWNIPLQEPDQEGNLSVEAVVLNGALQRFRF